MSHNCKSTNGVRNLLYSNTGIIVCLLIWSIISQLFVNLDSPLHYSFGHIDSTWFYMCGKAWINGMIPYVDFSDSKGPLLWLIYGIGYLIDPIGFKGVYLLACIYYTCVLWVCYKIALIFFNGQRRLAFLAAATMVVPYFCWLDYEVRAESWCQLSLIYCLYRLCISLLKPTACHSVHAMLNMGIFIAAVILIKWNLAVLYSLIPITIGIIAIISGKNRLRHAVALPSVFVLGIIVTCIPFIIILSWQGALRSCIAEYVMATSATIASDTGNSFQQLILGYYNDGLQFINSSRIWSIAFITCTIPLFHKIGGFRQFIPFSIGLSIIAGLHVHDMRYYQMGVASMGIFLFIWAYNSIKLYYKQLKIKYVLLFLAIILCWCMLSVLRTHNNIVHLSPNAANVSYIEKQLPAHKHPTILNYFGTETGIGITKGYLPSSKYWSLQSGASSQAVSHQDSILQSGKADVVTYLEFMTPAATTPAAIIRQISDAGYEYIGSLPWDVDAGLHSTQHVFTKKESKQQCRFLSF